MYIPDEFFKEHPACLDCLVRPMCLSTRIENYSETHYSVSVRRKPCANQPVNDPYGELSPWINTKAVTCCYYIRKELINGPKRYDKN